MFVKCSVNLSFYMREAVDWSVAGEGGDVEEENFYLDRPRSRMYIVVAAQHVDRGQWQWWVMMINRDNRRQLYQ